MCLYNVPARWTVKTDKFTLFVYCNFLVLLSTTVCSQNINKQNVNIADATFTNYSFLSTYHYTKSKNYLKRRYQIRHWIPMFIGTACSLNKVINSENFLYCFVAVVNNIILLILENTNILRHVVNQIINSIN